MLSIHLKLYYRIEEEMDMQLQLQLQLQGDMQLQLQLQDEDRILVETSYTRRTKRSLYP